MTSTYLIVDCRERFVLPFIETDFGAAGESFTTHQINTGDYLICRASAGSTTPEILTCIERKTLKDFASSFKDGRYLNRKKMLALRAQHGCQLYFFVEGTAFPSLSRKICRVPYSAILAAMTNMMLRDGIHIVQTQNEAHTSQRLLDFVKALRRIEIPFRVEHPAPNTISDIGETESAAQADPRLLAIPEPVTGLVARSDEDICVCVWSRLRNVSIVTGKVLTRAFSVADLVSGRVASQTVASLRSPANRLLGKRTLNSIEALRKGDRVAETKVLSGVPGVSPAMAAQVLQNQSLRELLAHGTGAVAAIAIKQKGRTVRLGATRAARICRLLRWQAGQTDPASAAAALNTLLDPMPRPDPTNAATVERAACLVPEPVPADARGVPLVLPPPAPPPATKPEPSPTPTPEALRAAARPSTIGHPPVQTHAAR